LHWALFTNPPTNHKLTVASPLHVILSIPAEHRVDSAELESGDANSDNRKFGLERTAVIFRLMFVGAETLKAFW